MPIELFSFRYRDPFTGRWIRARYKAERHEIAARYAEWEILGAEMRDARPGTASFNPFRVVPHAEWMRLQEPALQVNPHLENPPAIDAWERFLAALFLRRYVAYCAKRQRFSQMQGAARLHREISRGAAP